MRHYTRLLTFMIIVCFFVSPLSIAHSVSFVDPPPDCFKTYPPPKHQYEPLPCEEIKDDFRCAMCCRSNFFSCLRYECSQYYLDYCKNLCFWDCFEEYTDCREMCYE